MNYYLVKTDPETYSISNLKKDKETIWDGVRNFQAINFIKAWEIGDKLFIYHSQGETKIMGLAEVIGTAFKDPNDDRNVSWAAKIKFIKEFDPQNQVSLTEIKNSGLFDDFLLVRNPRLSVIECPKEFVTWMSERAPL
jgi:predicted RNA-binding protein with PUA-like domain